MRCEFLVDWISAQSGMPALPMRTWARVLVNKGLLAIFYMYPPHGCQVLGSHTWCGSNRRYDWNFKVTGSQLELSGMRSAY